MVLILGVGNHIEFPSNFLKQKLCLVPGAFQHSGNLGCRLLVKQREPKSKALK